GSRLPQLRSEAVVGGVTAIVLLARSAVRRHWRSIVVLTALVGVAGGVVLGAVAGARRTSTALDRFERHSLAADLEVDAGDATPAQLRSFARSPSVVAVAQLQQLAIDFRGRFLPLAAAVGGR